MSSSTEFLWLNCWKKFSPSFCSTRDWTQGHVMLVRQVAYYQVIILQAPWKLYQKPMHLRTPIIDKKDWENIKNTVLVLYCLAYFLVCGIYMFRYMCMKLCVWSRCICNCESSGVFLYYSPSCLLQSKPEVHYQLNLLSVSPWDTPLFLVLELRGMCHSAHKPIFLG